MLKNGEVACDICGMQIDRPVDVDSTEVECTRCDAKRRGHDDGYREALVTICRAVLDRAEEDKVDVAAFMAAVMEGREERRVAGEG